MHIKENFVHYRTCVCNINYYMVWSVKYRRKISAVILNIRASRIDLKRTVDTGSHDCLKGERGMLLSHRTSVKIRPEYSNIIGHMCYAASKLWNVCNYERHHYKELGLEKYPDWYYQKKAHKGDLWYRQLSSQTAQEICKQLDKAWRLSLIHI